MKMAAADLARSPLSSMGKGRDRGALEPNHHPFLAPSRQGEGYVALTAAFSNRSPMYYRSIFRGVDHGLTLTHWGSEPHPSEQNPPRKECRVALLRYGIMAILLALVIMTSTEMVAE